MRFSHKRLLSIIALLFYAIPSAENIVNCSNCSYRESSWECPKEGEAQFGLQLKNHEEESGDFLQVNCKFSSFPNFTYLKGCFFPSVNAVKIRLCPFFNEPFAKVFRQIGVEPAGVEKLTVYYSKGGVTALNSDHMIDLTNLAFLNFDMTGLTSLSKDAFKHTSHLLYLNIHGNKWTAIHKDIFKNLTDLKNLLISNNGLQEIPEDLFQNSINLENVVCESNNFENLPEKLLHKLVSLKNLSFHGNRISMIPEDFLLNNFNLELVSFSNNNLSKIPEQLFRSNTLLKIIELENNVLTTLPELTFNKLIHLTKINLSNNRLSYLKEKLFFNLKQLEVIELDNNFIDVLPRGIFRACSSLKELFLRNNSLSNINFFSFPNTPTLKSIDLSHNNLTTMGVMGDNGEFALNLQITLVSIDLSYNRFETFPDVGWTNFLNLEELFFEGNHLKIINFNDIFALPSDCTLSLKNNGLHSITGDYPQVKKVVNILLQDNNLTCDCNIFSLVKQIKNYNLKKYDDSFAILKVVDKNQLKCHRPVKLANQNLTLINLSDLECKLPDSHCSIACHCTLNPFNKMVIIKCTNNLKAQLDMKFMPDYNYTLDLSGNNISSLHLPIDNHIVNLNLSNNALTGKDFKTARNLSTNLRSLILCRNNLTFLSEPFLSELGAMESLTEVDLTFNPWQCDCTTKPLFDFIQVHIVKIKNIENIICKEQQKPLMKLNNDDICPLLQQPMFIASIGCGSIFIVLMAVLGTVSFYRYKTGIKVWLFTNHYCLWIVTEDEFDSDKEYDAFISYSHQDEEYVKSILEPRLENGPPKYRLCLHYRDWIGGEYIQKQILDSVSNSRRTIVVVSKNFIESTWAQMEFRIAHQQAMDDRTNRVIVIVHGEMPPQESLDEELRHYISMHTYLKSDQPRFWENLRYAMPHPKPVSMQKKQEKSKANFRKQSVVLS